MATAKITLSASRDDPFNKLMPSQSNVRRIKTGVSIEELAEDIAWHSLLRSLNARPVLDGNGRETGMFEVPVGRRRFQALELLVKQKRMSKTKPVLCVVRTKGLAEEVISDGLLSDAQLESVVYAGEAHAGYLTGSWTVDETFDVVSAAPDDAEAAVRFRRGWFLGDGIGAGKGRQVAGIQLNNWFKGRRRAVWISKSDKLIEDAQRDWSALGHERHLITPLAHFRQGTPIRLEEGILFTTYATLRSDERDEKVSRVQQMVDWLGRDFDGVIVFDGSHAMQNAAGEKSERGEQGPSQQGRAGLRLQHTLLIGLISEIIARKLRLSVPTGPSGPTILAKLMERHPLVRAVDKAAA